MLEFLSFIHVKAEWRDRWLSSRRFRICSSPFNMFPLLQRSIQNPLGNTFYKTMSSDYDIQLLFYCFQWWYSRSNEWIQNLCTSLDIHLEYVKLQDIARSIQLNSKFKRNIFSIHCSITKLPNVLQLLPQIQTYFLLKTV